MASRSAFSPVPPIRLRSSLSHVKLSAGFRYADRAGRGRSSSQPKFFAISSASLRSFRVQFSPDAFKQFRMNLAADVRDCRRRHPFFFPADLGDVVSLRTNSTHERRPVRHHSRSFRTVAATVCGFDFVTDYVCQCHFRDFARVIRSFARPVFETCCENREDTYGVDFILTYDRRQCHVRKFAVSRDGIADPFRRTRGSALSNLAAGSRKGNYMRPARLSCVRPGLSTSTLRNQFRSRVLHGLRRTRLRSKSEIQSHGDCDAFTALQREDECRRVVDRQRSVVLNLSQFPGFARIPASRFPRHRAGLSPVRNPLAVAQDNTASMRERSRVAVSVFARHKEAKGCRQHAPSATLVDG